MFYLIWEMGILLVLAVGFGVFVGYQLWSGDARSAEADAAIAENARLRQENENLARRLGEAETAARSAKSAADPAPAKAATPAAADSETVAPEPAKAPEAEPTEAPAAKPAPSKAPASSKTKAKPASKPAASAKSATKPAAKSKAKTASQPAAKETASEDLSVIKGLGPKAAAALKAGGISSVSQIAAWSDADIDSWDEKINGRGRIRRDDWVGQAKTLTS